TTGVVKAIRVTTFSPEFTERLHRAIRGQAAGKEFSREEFTNRSLKIYEKYSPAELAAKAFGKTKGGD
ncbi:MAG TPA: hypothetical protein PKY82_26460, partial [Pyrinomonadaceae bacterium]|nr:hypothetical protein [Pyrinomonadaceae bacterium]